MNLQNSEYHDFIISQPEERHREIGQLSRKPIL